MFGTRKRICGPPWTGPTHRKEGEGIFCCNFRAAKAQDTCEKIDHISQAQEDYRIMRILLVQCHESKVFKGSVPISDTNKYSYINDL